jgi:hypothetical protein
MRAPSVIVDILTIKPLHSTQVRGAVPSHQSSSSERNNRPFVTPDPKSRKECKNYTVTRTTPVQSSDRESRTAYASRSASLSSLFTTASRSQYSRKLAAFALALVKHSAILLLNVLV